MLADIAENRDAAVKRYARELDKWESGEFRVSADTIRKVGKSLPDSFKEDLNYAIKQVTGFARKQLETLQSFETEMEPGIVLGQKMIPVERVGCYVPGGKFPLVASAIMSVGTAKTAGVSYVTANSLVAKLEKAGLLQKTSIWGRNRVFRFQAYLALFAVETSPSDTGQPVSPDPQT